MATVTFPIAVGGDGSTVSDDRDPTTGLRGGGYQTRFVPALSQTVAIAQNTVTKAEEAAASAATAVNSPGTNATSTTSHNISTGAKTYTVQPGKLFVPGMRLSIANTASPGNANFAYVQTYNSGTGALEVVVDAVAGSGAGITAWTVALSGFVPGLGANVAAFLGTPSSDNLRAALTDETGTGAAVFANSPALVTPTLGTPASGNLSNCTADGTDQVGFRNIPQNSRSAAYTLVLSDAGKHILHPSSDATARVFTIPANASVAYPIGTALTFINQNGAGTLTIAITSNTMRLAGAGTTGSRTLDANGVATAVKIASTEWIISGTGLT